MVNTVSSKDISKKELAEMMIGKSLPRPLLGKHLLETMKF